MMKKLSLFLLVGLIYTATANAQTSRGLSMPAEPTSKPEGKTYALIIGISKYKNLPSLQFADRDAEAFYDFLRSAAGGNVDSNNIRMILNERACAGDIWRDIGWLLRRANQPGDRAFIYFSGHGDAANAEEAYLLAHDAPNEGDPNLYNAGGTFQIYNLKAKIKQMTSAGVQVVLITDACRSNELPGKAEGSKWAFEKIMEKQSGEIQLASCSSNEQSQESINWGGGRGVFSYYLINGLAGMADEDADGRVSFFEIQQYLVKNVRKDTKSPTTGKPRQTPVFCCGEYSDVVLGNKDEKLLAQMNITSVSGNLIADAGRRGISFVEPELKVLYAQYENAISADRLIDPIDSSAAFYLNKLREKVKDEDTRTDLSDRLVAQLINEAQVLINDYSKGRGKFSYDPGAFSDAALKLSVAMNYIQDLELKKELNASRLFLEAREVSESEDDVSKFQLAIAKADSSLAINPNQAHVLHTLGTIYFGLKHFDKALDYEYRAMRIANNWSLPYVMIGFIYAEGHDHDSAIYFLRKAIQVNPHHNNDLAYYYRKYVNQPDSGLHYLYKMIEIYPKEENGYIRLGKYYYAENRDSSIYYYRKAGSVNPNTSNALMALAEMYDGLLGRPDSALIYVHRAIQINPRNLEAIFNLAYAYMHLNKIDSAFYFFSKAKEMRPNFIYYHLAVFYSYINNKPLALENLEKAIQKRLNNFKYIQIDSDLANIRSTPEYKALMRKYFPDQYKE